MQEALTKQHTTDITKLFESQRKFAPKQKQATALERIAKLRKLEKLILAWQPKIEAAVQQDFRKAPTETALTEIYKVLDDCRHTAKHLKKWMKPRSVGTPLPFLGTSAKVLHEPKGTVLIISPWNYPFSLGFGPLVYALAAGNTVVLKPSEMTPKTSAVMKDMVAEAFPTEELAVVEGGVETSQELLALPFDHIFFTGSPTVGKIVMKAASANLTSVTLELGGKSPVFLDETADLKDAAEKIAWGKFMNGGQTCVAPDYLLVPRNREAELVAELKKATEKYYSPEGKPVAESPDYCRIINEKHFGRIEKLIGEAVENGAKVAFGGEVAADQRFIAPTVLTHVSPGHQVMQEEIFGPVLPVVTYDKVEEALELVNSMPKPLALYIFTKKRGFTKHILQNTTAGGTVVNDVVLHFAHSNLPFGGVNNSGIGKSHGRHGFLAFSNERSLLKQRVGFTGIKLFYPPYTDRTKKLIKTMMKWV